MLDLFYFQAYIPVTVDTPTFQNHKLNTLTATDYSGHNVSIKSKNQTLYIYLCHKLKCLCFFLLECI